MSESRDASPDAEALRGYWSLDPEVLFLNHGSFGACPRAGLDKQAELRSRMEGQPLRFFVRELEGLLASEARSTPSRYTATPEMLDSVRCPRSRQTVRSRPSAHLRRRASCRPCRLGVARADRVTDLTEERRGVLVEHLERFLKKLHVSVEAVHQLVLVEGSRHSSSPFC